MKKEPDVVLSDEPENNGDYTYCDTCRGHVPLDWTTEGPEDENGYKTYLHRGHQMDATA